MATSEMWKDSKTGEKTSHTDWHNIVIKRPGLVEIGEQYIHKGSRLYLEGKVRNRSYTSNGETKYITEIVTEEFVLLSPKTSEAVSVHDVMLNEPTPNSDFALENAMEESPY
jgi:single-strand DNA-binding protein